MHRSVSIAMLESFTCFQRSGGTSSASVGHDSAQGMSVHITHAVTFTLSEGVPAANPASLPSGRIAWAGQAAVHSPQRVQAARNAASGSAPGGRVYWPGENLFETASKAWPSARRRPVEKNDRRTLGSAIVLWNIRWHCRCALLDPCARSGPRESLSRGPLVPLRAARVRA